MTVLNGISNIEDGPTVRRRFKKCTQKLCSKKTLRNRFPIITWLPTYNLTILIQDIIAGITVGLTAIPQGIAYAIVAGLSPEYGLYSGLMGGFIYVFLGSCKCVTIGPTAIMAAMTSKYVYDYTSDFAVLVCFVTGIVVLAMGVLNLGFLVDFISSPVIKGFTNAAALQIAAGQLKSLFGLEEKSGNHFAESVYYFIKNIKTAKLWDPILGFCTILTLIFLKHLGQGCGRTDPIMKQLRWFLSLARNAIVVIIGIIAAYVLKVILDREPLVLIGDIGGGLPKFRPPPFSTTMGDQIYSFRDMVSEMGVKAIVLPLVCILESVAIAKAFSEGLPVNATQEMIALGICNIIGSFVRSMPVSGSFTRTALNYASGVQTPAGGIFTGMLIILALSLLTSTFYFISKASLAGLIVTAMFSMIDYTIFKTLWANSKREFIIMIITTITCLILGLEYGIMAGIALDAAVLLFISSRPHVDVKTVMGEKADFIVVCLTDKLSYCAAEHVRKTVIKASQLSALDSTIIVNGTELKSMDTTVATNLISVVKDIEKNSRQVKFLNFNPVLMKMCLDINPKFENKFILAPNVTDLEELSSKTISSRNISSH